MNNYDINIDYARATIEVTLQQWEHIGHYRIQVKGNVKGAEALEIALDTEFLESEDIIWNDCDLDIGDESFKAILRDEEENELIVEDDLSELEDLVVGIKIIDYKEEKE